MARTLDKTAQDTLRGHERGPQPRLPEGPDCSVARGGVRRACSMPLLGVEGCQGRLNDVLFQPALRRSAELPPRQRTLVFFGGDVQNFLHLMDQSNPNIPVNDWCLETTARRLGEGYPYHHIVVIKPSRIAFDDISCFDHFVAGNQLGVPTHMYHFSAVPHLEKLLKTMSHKIKRMQTEELCKMLFNTDEEDGFVNVDHEGNDNGSKRMKMTVSEMEMCCWWQKNLKLHKYQLTLVAFSKGCVVLNQFLYEFHYARHLAPENQDSSIINRLEAMYWLDGGHPGHSNTWLTARALLQTLTRLGICVHVHVSKYQVEDQSRPWIGKEEKEFVATLRTLGAKVFRHLHVSDKTDLFAHFNVLAKFMEVEKNLSRRLAPSNSTSDPGSGPSSSISGSSQNPIPFDPQNSAPGSLTESSDHGSGGSSIPGPSDYHDAPILIHSIVHLPGNHRSEIQIPTSDPNLSRYSGHFSPLNIFSTPSGSYDTINQFTFDSDPVSVIYALNLNKTLQISPIKPLWNHNPVLTVTFESSKLPIEILSTAVPHPTINSEINLVVSKIMAMQQRRTVNAYSHSINSPVLCIFDEESSLDLFNPVGIDTTVGYNHSLYTVSDRKSTVKSISNSPDQKVNAPTVRIDNDTATTLANTASISNAVKFISNSKSQRVNGPVANDSDTATPANATTATRTELVMKAPVTVSKTDKTEVEIPVSFATSETVSNAFSASVSEINSAPVSTAFTALVSNAPSVLVSTATPDPGSIDSSAPVLNAPSASIAPTATAAPRVPQIRRPRRNSFTAAPSPFLPVFSRESRGNSMPSDIDYYATPDAPLDDNAPARQPPPVASGVNSGVVLIATSYHFSYGASGHAYMFDRFEFVDPVNRHSTDLSHSDSEEESLNHDAEPFSEPEPLSDAESSNGSEAESPDGSEAELSNGSEAGSPDGSETVSPNDSEAESLNGSETGAPHGSEAESPDGSETELPNALDAEPRNALEEESFNALTPDNPTEEPNAANASCNNANSVPSIP